MKDIILIGKRHDFKSYSTSYSIYLCDDELCLHLDGEESISVSVRKRESIETHNTLNEVTRPGYVLDDDEYALLRDHAKRTLELQQQTDKAQAALASTIETVIPETMEFPNFG